jgi:hypothetical protein
VNGLAFVVCLAVVALGLLIAYAKRRDQEQQDAADDAEQVRDGQQSWPLDPTLRHAREVRKTFDDLPYRGGRGWK